MTTPRAPDCFQRTPRRISIPEGLSPQILSLAVDAKGIHTIMKGSMGSRLSYSVFALNSGRQEAEAPFPSEPAAFLGLDSSDISLTCVGEVSHFLYIILQIIVNHADI